MNISENMQYYRINQWKLSIFTRGQFLVFGYCRCLPVSGPVSVCQPHHLFKLEPPPPNLGNK